MTSSYAQSDKLRADAQKTMLKASKYMVDDVSTNGGYVYTYLPDFSRRWGELEAYDTQIWIQPGGGGTLNMGNNFLDAYHVTGNEYYYQAAEKVGKALIWGQLPWGGWNYMVDFAGDRSLKRWYHTIGENAWGFEEFYHYYGNATFDDDVTAGAARFLLRLYLEKQDPVIKRALDKAIDFILQSQYALGGWPQRYPLSSEFPHGKGTDYTPFYTFNDQVAWNNIEFLIQCYKTLGQERLLEPIRRGMNFYLLTQQGNPQGGWALQYNMRLEPAHARHFEPAALAPGTTNRIIHLLMRFYRYTGDRRFLSPIPDAIQWLKNTRLLEEETDNSQVTHPVFVEPGTNKALYAHRKGTGVTHGRYWVDYNDKNPLLHYGAKTRINIDQLRKEYEQLRKLSEQEATKGSPLKERRYQGDATPQEDFIEQAVQASDEVPEEIKVRTIIKELDEQGRWLSKHEWISQPYAVNSKGEETNTAMLSTKGGAQVKDSTEQQYISTNVYIENMHKLMSYINQNDE